VRRREVCPRRVRACIVLVASVAVVTLALTSCTPVPPRDRLELEQVGAIASQLQCDSSQVLQADMAFYDDMRGLNCFFDDEQTVLIRAYQNDASLGHVVSDLAPTITAENQIIVGQNWYATGTPAKLRELTHLLRAPTPEPTFSPGTTRQLSPKHEARGMCSAYVTSVVHSYLFEPDQVSALTDGSQDAYPGLLSIVRRVGEELREEKVSAESFDWQVTAHADVVREYCAKIYH
jgi:hypothetical protein